MRRFGASALGLLAGLAPAAAAVDGGWTARVVEGVSPVAEVRPLGDGRAFIRTATGWRRIVATATGPCLAEARPPARLPMPKGGLPDGEVVSAPDLGVARAWLSRPTRRYDHGILGDAIEAGGFVVVDTAGKRHELVLPKGYVFEDLYPRIFDLEGDGRPDFAIIVSSLKKGASVIVYSLTKDGLKGIKRTPHIGRPHRWLNPVGIADFDGDGIKDVALVATPHIGGTVRIWSLGRRNPRLLPGETGGFSNHWIGSRILLASGIADIDGDGRPELFVPSGTRKDLRILRYDDGLRQFAWIALPGRVSSALAFLAVPGRPPLVFHADDRGRLVAVAFGKAPRTLPPCAG